MDIVRAAANKLTYKLTSFLPSWVTKNAPQESQLNSGAAKNTPDGSTSHGKVTLPEVTLSEGDQKVGGRRRTRHKKHKSCKRKKSYKGGNVAFLDARTSLGSSNIVGGKKSRKKRSKKRSNKSNK